MSAVYIKSNAAAATKNSTAHPAAAPQSPAVRYEGAYVTLERLHARHFDDLWASVQGHDGLYAYTGHGPFAKQDAFNEAMIGLITNHRRPAYAILYKHQAFNVEKAVGYIAYDDFIDDASNLRKEIELGPVVFSPVLQRTCAATEAVYLLMRAAFDSLQYGCVKWCCKEENVGSRKAAERLGFKLLGMFPSKYTFAGLTPHSAWYVMHQTDWPIVDMAFRQWLAADNFDDQGRQRQSLQSIRHTLDSSINGKQ